MQNQHRKLKNDTILQDLWTKKSTDLGEIDKNGRILLAKKGFVRWIQIINPNTIIVDLREKFKIYQRLIMDYLFGAVETESQAKIDYVRLRKLKRLYAKIGKEIHNTEKGVNNYLNNKFQLQLDLK